VQEREVRVVRLDPGRPNNYLVFKEAFPEEIWV